MEPTLTDGDELNVLRYDSRVANGDLVVFRAPTSTDREFLKRVIATPGQTVEIDAGQVKVDGVILHELSVKGTTQCTQTLSTSCRFDVPPLASGSPALPGDGSDARPRATSLEAEAAACATTGCYFVMGDNRQNSSDSRQGWLVPTENIIGYVEEPN